VSQGNVNCGDEGIGTATAVASGGSGNITYLWSDGQIGETATGLHAGTYTVVATDQNGCSDNSTVIITSTDLIPPVAMAQNVVVVLNASGLALVNANNVNASSFDNCGSVNVSLDVNTFDCSQLGENVVQLIATDGAGNSSMASAIVTVVDNMAPTIDCVENIIHGSCSEPVNYTLPVAFDNCSANAPELLLGLGAGAVFPVGNSIEVYRVTDNSGNSSTCSFTIVVEDTESPEITCPSDISLFGCEVEVIYSLPTALDACSSVGMPMLTLGLGSGASYPEGLHTEVYEVLDAAGNSASCNFTITIVNDVDGDIAALQNACFGMTNGSATITGEGGAGPYSFSWNNGQTTATATNLAPALYNVIVTDANGCSNQVFVTIGQNPEMLGTLDNIQNETGSNQNGAIDISVSGGAGSYAFLWSGDNGFNSVNEDISGLSAGTYSCLITDVEGCITEMGPFEVQMVSGINEPGLDDLINIYPNPTDGVVHILLNDLVQDEVQLSLFNIAGQELSATAITHTGNQVYTLNLSGQATGVYLLKVHIADEVLVKRIIFK
jgi:hypothetical protein